MNRPAGVLAAPEPAAAQPAPVPRAPDVAVSVRAAGKMYRIYERPLDRLKQMLFARFGRSYGREFWALREVSLDVRRGESLGILGRNGSGKSTLLQLVAGTLAPTTGEVRTRGRVTALLELGSGFNPEFTGRENVLLNGAILGLSAADMAARFDQIAAFADIGDFIDQPVKLYSSGMLMRLAFSVATAVEPDVLLVDEALAVGDVFFRQKCYLRLEALRASGVSVVLVSHAAHEVEQYCQRAILLDRGHVLFEGPSVEAVKRYYLHEQQARARAQPAACALPEAAEQPSPEAHAAPEMDWPADARADVAGRAQVSNGRARCLAVGVTDTTGHSTFAFQQGETAVFWAEFELLDEIEVPVGGLMIHNERGVAVHGKHTLQHDCPVPTRVARGARLRFRHELALRLSIQDYTFEVTFSALRLADYQRRAAYVHDELYARIEQVCVVTRAGAFRVALRPVGARPIQMLHHGAADLPGRCTVAAVPAPTTPA